ncbi:MAG TPA: hypothetical protein VM689_00320 [Aliidongia sp.]|nr:hypothetical protein [Aliidongia sp.]
MGMQPRIARNVGGDIGDKVAVSAIMTKRRRYNLLIKRDFQLGTSLEKTVPTSSGGHS